MQNFPVIIIGAGPAGLITALQLKRFGIPALCFEGGRIGGLLHNANLVENYLGFPRGISGPALVKVFEKQAQNIGVEILFEKILSLDHDGEKFEVTTNKAKYQSQIAVVASGTKPRTFAKGFIPAEARKRVFYEVYPLLGEQGRDILIVGAGDAAFDYALNLARENRVTILNRGTQIRALGLLQERARKNANIVYHEKAQVERISLLGEGRLTVEITHRDDVEITEADFMLGAIGRTPRLGFLSPNLEEKEAGLMKRGILHYVGDVKNGIYRQTAIAVGDGLRAAMKIDQILKEHR